MKKVIQIFNFLKPSIEDLNPLDRKELAALIYPELNIERKRKKKKEDPVPSKSFLKQMLLKSGHFKTGYGVSNI